MSNLFGHVLNQEDNFGFPAFPKSSLSPDKKDLDLMDDLHDPFGPSHEYPTGSIFGQPPHDFNWESLKGPSNLSRGTLLLFSP
jgi:hypothetical protein